ncbi:MAG: hypothetical protein R3335_13740, partial [Anaerolineales bacterium]|nr:hypothetical protein [Anaerolineales bacterium]
MFLGLFPGDQPNAGRYHDTGMRAANLHVRLVALMRGTGAGWDSRLYRIFIVGGLIGIVSVSVYAALRADSLGLDPGEQTRFVMIA